MQVYNHHPTPQQKNKKRRRKRSRRRRNVNLHGNINVYIYVGHISFNVGSIGTGNVYCFLMRACVVQQFFATNNVNVLPWPVNDRTFMGSSWPAIWTSSYSSNEQGCSSVDSVPAFEAVGRRIDPSQWTQLQFGLFSVPTSGPQLVYQRPWYVLFCLWKSAYKRSLAAYRKE